MTSIRRFGHFWYDFIVGDDWRLALASAAALGLCGLLSHLGVTSWWLVPGVVVATLTVTMIRMPPPLATGATPGPPASLAWSDDDGVTPSAEVEE